MFSGFVALNDTFNGAFIAKNSSEVPVDADSSPTFKVFGPTGLMTGGTGIASKLSSDAGYYAYGVTIDPSNGYEVGTLYNVMISVTISAVTTGYQQSFIVS